MLKIKKVSKAKKPKKRKEKKPISIITIIVIVVVVGYVSFAFYKLEQRSRSLQMEIDEASNQIKEEEKLIKDLERKENLINSEEYIEQKAREMGMVKPDEKIYVDITN